MAQVLWVTARHLDDLYNSYDWSLVYIKIQWFYTTAVYWLTVVVAKVGVSHIIWASGGWRVGEGHIEGMVHYSTRLELQIRSNALRMHT